MSTLPKNHWVNLHRSMLPAPAAGGFRMEGYWVWCGSVVKGEDGRYHMFASRWPKNQPMHPGWLLGSEVVRASSDTPEGPYHFEEVVLPVRGPQYWDGRMTHNPHIKKIGNRYVLFYTGSTHPFADPTETLKLDDPCVIVARANKRVGIAVSDSVFGPWKRMDSPILPTRPDKFDNLLTSNPAPCVNPDGSVLLMYKARGYNPPPYIGLLHGDMTLGVAYGQTYQGPYRVLQDDPLFPPQVSLEDPFIWNSGSEYEMIAKDMTGNICGEKYGGVHAYSTDGRHWDICMGELAYSRKVLWDDGETRLMGNLERPFILFDDMGKPTHLFFATSDGTNGFHDATQTWNMVIPLKQE